MKKRRNCWKLQLGAGTDYFYSIHVRAQHFGDYHGAIGLLVIFDHRDQRSWQAQARPVKRVHEFSFAGPLWPIADISAPHLEIRAIRA